MAEVRMKWYGDEVVDEVLDVAAEGIENMLGDAQLRAKARCPVETGNLQSNIIVEEMQRDDTEVALALGVDASVDYAEEQENRHHFLESSVSDLSAFLPRYIQKAADKRQGI